MTKIYFIVTHKDGVKEYATKQQAYQLFHDGNKIEVVHVDFNKILSFDNPESYTFLSE